MTYKTKSIIIKISELLRLSLVIMFLSFMSSISYKSNLYGCGTVFILFDFMLVLLLIGKLDELYWHVKSFKKVKP